MSEENKMTEENKKTIIAFIAGLLVGGLLVFIFVNPAPANDNASEDEDAEVTEVDNTDSEDDSDTEDSMSQDDNGTTSDNTTVVDGSVSVDDQNAGNRVTFTNANFPSNEGWIGVREYQNGQLVGLLGVSRWNKSEGLNPTSVSLLRPTVSGQTYALVFYSENGDGVFSLASDAQMGGVMGTFEAE